MWERVKVFTDLLRHMTGKSSVQEELFCFTLCSVVFFQISVDSNREKVNGERSGYVTLRVSREQLLD